MRIYVLKHSIGMLKVFTIFNVLVFNHDHAFVISLAIIQTKQQKPGSFKNCE